MTARVMLATLVLTLFSTAGYADQAPRRAAGADRVEPMVHAAAGPASSDAAAGQPAARPAAPAKRSPNGLARWLELGSATLGVRYRAIETSQHVLTNNQVQHNQAFKVRLRLDRAAHYSLNAGVFTGNSITSGWNNSGVGTGAGMTKLYVKQLFLAAMPVKEVELQSGSLYFARGENTEITSYDNDAYVTGVRASVKHPKALFFDEISATRGHVETRSTPSVFDRGASLTRTNYWQGLVAKRVGRPLAASADYTRVSGTETVRAAVTLRGRRLGVIDTLRVEAYRRLAGASSTAGGGWSAYAERAIVKPVVAGGGWADIDARYGGLNADRFNKGRRLFVNGTLAISPELSVQTFYTLAAKTRYPVPNRSRFDLIFTYNLLKTLQRGGVF